MRQDKKDGTLKSFLPDGETSVLPSFFTPINPINNFMALSLGFND